MQLDIRKLANSKVLVVGDVMLDQYWHGHTSRISPEAPVPVVNVKRHENRLGGASNVALNAKALGATVSLLGVVGQDESGQALEDLLTQADIHSALIHSSKVPTITKLRILSHHQQLIRLDVEEDLRQHEEEILQTTYLRCLAEANVVVLSDYSKGTILNPAFFIQAAKEKNIPVLVDPKNPDFSVYRGATVVTPNAREFQAYVGTCHSLHELETKAQALSKAQEVDCLLVTRSEDGMSVIPKAGDITHIPTHAQEVYDVTGAGDTVIAAMAVALAAGQTLVESAKLANIAAGLAVAKVGTSAVSLKEIQAAIGEPDVILTGVMDENVLMEMLELARAKGEKIVFTNGCFDILHAGHVSYLEQAKQMGDRLIVAVNTDQSVKQLKGDSRPVNPLEHRMNVLSGLSAVDWVVPFADETPERLLKILNPNVLVKGGDYQNPKALPGAKYIESIGGRVQILGLKPGCSTTSVISSIMEG